MDQLFAVLHTDAAHLVAVLLTGFYAWTRFATPKTLRSETTRIQYWGSCVFYVVSCIGLLMFVSSLLANRPQLLGFLYFPDPIPDSLKRLDAPLVAALILTTLLPSVPVLRDADAVMLQFFHRLGAIPLGAVRWAQRMNMAQLTISKNLLADTKHCIANSALLPDSLTDQLQPDFALDSARFRFTRVLALYVALNNLSGWSGFAADFPEERATFEKKMSSFFAQSVAFFALTSQLSQRQLEPVEDSVDKFRSYALDAYEDIRLMLARVLLYSCNSDAEVALQLTRIGFSIQRPSLIRLPLNLLSVDAAGVVVLFVIAAFLSDGNFGKTLAIGMLVGVNHSIAAVCALAPKQLWQFADFRSARERPFLSYLFSGACALTITLPISYAFYLLRVNFPLDDQPIMPFLSQAKWLLLSTVHAIALAFACDDLIEAEHEPWWLRWLECVALAALMALSGLLTIRWLHLDQPLWLPVLLSASIGALFGATIPYWYRKSVRGTELNYLTGPVLPRTDQVAPAI